MEDSVKAASCHRIIISGSRHYTNYSVVKKWCDKITANLSSAEIVSGKEPNGVDAMGERWADEKGYPVKGFPALWKIHGKAAGPLRNRQMAEYATHLIAFWNGSKANSGTFNMINEAYDRKLEIRVIRIDANEPYYQPIDKIV